MKAKPVPDPKIEKTSDFNPREWDGYSANCLRVPVFVKIIQLLGKLQPKKASKNVSSKRGISYLKYKAN